MLPYLAFLGYANALNYSFWQNNPDVSDQLQGALSQWGSWWVCGPACGWPSGTVGAAVGVVAARRGAGGAQTYA